MLLEIKGLWTAAESRLGRRREGTVSAEGSVRPPGPAIRRTGGARALCRRAFVAIVALATLVVAFPSMARAAFPGPNGLVAFTREPEGTEAREIYTVAPDGTLRNLSNPALTPCFTDPCRHDDSPAFSAAGDKIVFASDRDGNFEIYVMNADGSDQTRLTNTSAAESDPAFSPDGTKIAYSKDPDNPDIYVMNADGSGQTNLTSDDSARNSDPAFSPAGNRIAFESGSDVHMFDAVDGGNRVNVTKGIGRGGSTDPAFSPDGSKLAISMISDQFGTLGQLNTDIATLSLDPANLAKAQPDFFRLTTHSATDTHPAWSPDGARIAFASRPFVDSRSATRDPEIYALPATGPDRNATPLSGGVLVGAIPEDADREPDWGRASSATPTPTPTATATPTATLTPTPTATPAPTSISTATPAPTATRTPTGGSGSGSGSGPTYNPPGGDDAPRGGAQARRGRALRRCRVAVRRHARGERKRAGGGRAGQRRGAARHRRRHARRGLRRCVRRFGRRPGRVKGLRARALTGSSIVLTFRAAGSDGRRSPPARAYVVRQSLRPLRGARALRRAQILCGGRCRLSAGRVGARVSLTVTDLRPGTTYFYAVAARDHVSGRRGPRSVVRVRTR